MKTLLQIHVFFTICWPPGDHLLTTCDHLMTIFQYYLILKSVSGPSTPISKIMYILMYILRDTFWANKVSGWGFAKD